MSLVCFSRFFFIDIVWLLFIIYFWLEKIETDKKKNKEKKGNKEKHRNTKNKIVIKFEKIFHQTKKLSNICWIGKYIFSTNTFQ